MTINFQTNDHYKNGGRNSHLPRPAVQQMYNLFHPSDPIAHRIEPLLSAKFSRAPPVNVPRYQKYPMGDGASHFLSDFIQTNTQLFAASGENNGLSQQNSGKLKVKEILPSILSTCRERHVFHLNVREWLVKACVPFCPCFTFHTHE